MAGSGTSLPTNGVHGDPQEEVEADQSGFHSFSFHEQDDSTSKKGCCCGFCGFVRRHWKIFLVIGILWLIVLIVMYFTLPSLIIQSRLNGANVSLRSASMQINADTSATLNPEIVVFAPQSLLSMPMISYKATIPPFQASVTVDRAIASEDGSGSSEQVELGIFKSSSDLKVDSSKDLNMRVTGTFTITGKDFLGDVVNHFIKSPNMPVNMKASMSLTAIVWGWMPIYLPSVSVHYTDLVPAMNNFATKDVTLDEINTANGQPGELTINCSAFVNNPSPASLIVNDSIQMRVAYQYAGQNHTIGRVSAPYFKVNPGDNVVNGTLVVQQNLDNSEAIVEMITAYMGGLQHGFDPSATKPFQVSIWDDGENSAHSEMLRNALHGLDLSLKFQPQPLTFLRSITSDISFMDWEKGHWRPEVYTAKVNIKVFNPLPQSASVLGVNLKAYQDNLSSEKLLYNFNRVFDKTQYVVPPQRETWVTFELKFFSEVSLPTSLSDIKDLAYQAAHKQIFAGVEAQLEMLVHPAYTQTVRYTNEQLSGYLCFHVGHTESMCGVGGAALETPAMHMEATPTMQLV